METTTIQDKKQQAGLNKGITIEHIFNLPVSTVWKAFTNEEYFKKWWGPKGFTCPSSKLEPKVGGTYLNCMRGPDGKDFWSTGTVKEFIPEKKLVITDSFADEKGNKIPAAEYGMPGEWPLESLITVKMEEFNGATKLNLHHEGIPPEMHDECIRGWSESLDKLEQNIK